MSDASSQHNKRPIGRQRSIYQVHYCLQRRQEEVMARPVELLDIQAYGQQVAGHMKTENQKYLGVLQCNNGTILKPIIKESQKREVEFYNRLTTAKEPQLVELMGYTPKYFGCRKFTYNGFEQDYIVLQDLAERMLEPCIMDVKIGKRTWDPLASEQKIKNEQSKYALCKQQYGFCIPGYQVHKLATGKLHKYNKEYGKNLHGDMVPTALKNFLNGIGTSLCRALILQFLSELWKIQRWVSRQTAVRLYSASLLLVYDAARLRDCCGEGDALSPQARCRAGSWSGGAGPARRRSVPALHDASFSGQLSAKGPVYRKVNSVPITPMSMAQSSFSPPSPINSPWSEALERLHHNHSFEHNYEEKICKIRMNYKAVLDQLSTDSPNPNPWGTVKIIDFAHAFFNEDDDMTIDTNFKEGIDNFVSIFEQFLKETDDQVF